MGSTWADTATPDQLRQAVRVMARAWAALEWQDRRVEMSDEEYHEYLAQLMRRKQIRREAV